MAYVTKTFEECRSYWEVYQMERYGKILQETCASLVSNEKEDTRMPDHFELEILQKGEE